MIETSSAYLHVSQLQCARWFRWIDGIERERGYFVRFCGRPTIKVEREMAITISDSLPLSESEQGKLLDLVTALARPNSQKQTVKRALSKLTHYLGSLLQGFRRFLFAFGRNQFRLRLSQRFGFGGHCTLQLHRQANILELHTRNFDAPDAWKASNRKINN